MPRRAKPGNAYGNRADLTRVAPGQEYGEATQQQRDIAAVPMDNHDRQVPQAQPQAPLPTPGTMPFLSPSQRPDEPVTAGAAMGPGPGPEALGAARQPMSTADELKQLASSPGASAGTQRLAALAAHLGV